MAEAPVLMTSTADGQPPAQTTIRNSSPNLSQNPSLIPILIPIQNPNSPQNQNPNHRLEPGSDSSATEGWPNAQWPGPPASRHRRPAASEVRRSVSWTDDPTEHRRGQMA